MYGKVVYVTIISEKDTIFTDYNISIREFSYFCVMEKDTVIFNTVSDYCDYFGFGVQHPLVSVVRFTHDGPVVHSHSTKWGLYALFLKQTKGCTINYGKTRYDYDDQSVVCFGPGQITQTIINPDVAMPESIGLIFHPDLLFRTSLAQKMRQYTFFGYESREALHLSAEERSNVEDCLNRIAKELVHPVDKFSKSLIASNIELLLDYCLRYYSRQFEVREVLNAGVMAKFDELLDVYVNNPEACAQGLPNVKFFADSMALSANYFGDLVKREAGVTAQDYIQDKLLVRAKSLLLNEGNNVSQTAYSLGFQYPQHFIRFFKRKTGVTPREFINAN